mmetsp:Transcript_4111/g.11666  ORF Transcript_4111/g.11666 Transcript_4111/m.11666 type:complete len:312 (+) Transcript_4111:89-1024(+)
MAASPAAPASAAASATKCPTTPVVNSKASRRSADSGDASANSPAAEAENSSWLVNTPERRPSRYGGVPFDVAQSAITASRSVASSRGGGGFGSTSSRSRRGNGNIDHGGDGAASAFASTAKSGGGDDERPNWEESESAPLSSLKQLLDGLEGRCSEADAGGRGSSSRSVFGSGTSVSGRRASWSLTSSSSSASRRRRRTSSSGGSSIVRIGSADGSSTFPDLAGSGRSAGMDGGGGADNMGSSGSSDGGGGIGLVSANKRGVAKRTRAEGSAAGAAAAPPGMPLANAGLMSPPSPAVTKSVLGMKKSKRRT